MEFMTTTEDILVSDERILTGSIENENNSNMEILKHDKGVSVVSDDRFTRITIDKNYKSENVNETFISTHIIKDKLLKTTETFIKKVFVHRNKKGEANVILREIVIDRFDNQSISENKSIHIKLDENESLESRVKSFLQLSPVKLLLN